MASCLAVAPLSAQQRPRWSSLDSIGLGQPVDDIVARGGQCYPAYRPDYESNRVIGEARGFKITPYMVLQHRPTELFGGTLPHSTHDTAAVRIALQTATLCRLPLLGGRALAYAVAFERTIDVVDVILSSYRGIEHPLPLDSARAYLIEQWGKGSGNERLLTWGESRYRSYLVVSRGQADSIVGWHAVLVDRRACDAFERRLHRGRGLGEPGTC